MQILYSLSGRFHIKLKICESISEIVKHICPVFPNEIYYVIYNGVYTQLTITEGNAGQQTRGMQTPLFDKVLGRNVAGDIIINLKKKHDLIFFSCQTITELQ